MRKFFAKLINSFLKPLKLCCLEQKQYQRLQNERRIFLKLAEEDTKVTRKPFVSCIIFSKDRACQLQALLRSMIEHVGLDFPITILYSTSNRRHKKSYTELRNQFTATKIEWIPETNFQSDLLDLLREVNTKWLFFLVDDMVFLRPVDFTVFANISPQQIVPSLRLGQHLRFCYTRNASMQLPQLEHTFYNTTNFLRWKWEEGEYNWAYPLSVDGHLFDPVEIRSIAEETQFQAPNSFERALQLARPIFLKRHGICFPETRVVNLPINKVQNENSNICGDFSQEFLLEKWEQGYQIDVEALYNTTNESVHQELTVQFAERHGDTV